MTDKKLSNDTHGADAGPEPVHKVMVVDGGIELLGDLEKILHARRYQILFAQSGDFAYSQIKEARPNLVVLCGRIESLDGAQLLTMLKLGPDTRGIPLLSYSPDRRAYGLDAETVRLADEEDAPTPGDQTLRMN